MDPDRLQDLYIQKGLGEAAAAEAVAHVRDLERHLASTGRTLETVDQDDLAAYVARLVETGDNSEARLLALARFFQCTGAHDLYIFFTSLFGSDGVLASIRERAEMLEGADTAAALFRDLPIPPLGTSPADLPPSTRRLMDNLQATLPASRARAILCGNHHGIPRESFLEERQRRKESESLDAYLKDRHRRMVDVLQAHCDAGTVWFEQRITQRVVDHVRAHQELLSAVREGDTLYATKIPYDPDRWLGETEPVLRRYAACHCPFVREAIRNGTPAVPSDWCYCSAGFEKLLFDEVLEADLEVELLESVLQGHDRCRFAIRLPEGMD